MVLAEKKYCLVFFITCLLWAWTFRFFQLFCHSQGWSCWASFA